MTGPIISTIPFTDPGRRVMAAIATYPKSRRWYTKEFESKTAPTRDRSDSYATYASPELLQGHSTIMSMVRAAGSYNGRCVNIQSSET